MPRIKRKTPAPAMAYITSSGIPAVLDPFPSASASVVGLLVPVGAPVVGDIVETVGARVEPVGAEVDVDGADVEADGALVACVGEGVDPVGAEVDKVGADVDRVGADVDFVGAAVDNVGATVAAEGAGVDIVGARVVGELVPDAANPQSYVEKRFAKVFSPVTRSLSSFGLSHSSQCPGSFVENVK